jgi:DNA mismatch endonuclease (patch repair protein)
MPGKPDITLAKMKVAVFVNGCFWHRHKNCKEASMPETNIDYWIKKFHKNVIRDKENIYKIKEGGWKTIVVWECETKNEKCLENRLRTILSARMREINLSN